MKHLLPLAWIVLLVPLCCTSQPGPNEHIYWVNSLKVPCVGVAPAQCLQVHKGEHLDPTEWKVFFDSIEGFEFEPGYVYKLRVKEEKLDKTGLPADASSMAYTLVKVLHKEKDKRLVLNEIWLLERLNGTATETGDTLHLQRPRLEIRVGEMKYSGTDGCNNYFGGIIELDESVLRFGIGAGTRKMCPDMKLADAYNKALPEVSSYKVKDLKLYLFDASGTEVMQFQKAD